MITQRKLFLILCSIFLITYINSAQAQRRESNPAISVLFGFGGRSTQTVEMFILRFEDIPHLVQIHFSNEPGRRSTAYQTDFLPRMNHRQYNANLAQNRRRVITRVMRRAEQIKAIYEPLGGQNTIFIWSTGLESVFSNRANRNIDRVLKSVWDIPTVRSPFSPHHHPGSDFLELHGGIAFFKNRLNEGILNFDGLSIRFGCGERYFNQVGEQQAQQIANTYSDVYALFFWSAMQQGLNNIHGFCSRGAIHPRNRKYIVTNQAIRGNRKLLRNTKGPRFIGLSAFAAGHRRFPAKRFLMQYPDFGE